MKTKDLVASDLDAKLPPIATSGAFWTPNRLHGQAEGLTAAASLAAHVPRAHARSVPPFRCRLANVETETNLGSLYMRISAFRLSVRVPVCHPEHLQTPAHRGPRPPAPVPDSAALWWTRGGQQSTGPVHDRPLSAATTPTVLPWRVGPSWTPCTPPSRGRRGRSETGNRPPPPVDHESGTVPCAGPGWPGP